MQNIFTFYTAASLRSPTLQSRNSLLLDHMARTTAKDRQTDRIILCAMRCTRKFSLRSSTIVFARNMCVCVCVLTTVTVTAACYCKTIAFYDFWVSFSIIFISSVWMWHFTFVESYRIETFPDKIK